MRRAWWRPWVAIRIVVLAVAPLGTPHGASAHPHVFVDYAVTLLFASNGLDGVRLTWTFDDLFSGFILQEFDADRDGALSAREVQRIEEKHLTEFRRASYYTTMNVNGKPAEPQPARDFRATASNGIVTYEFTLPLRVPLVPGTALELLIDDPVYYIAYTAVQVTPEKQAVGAVMLDCRVARDKSGATADAVRCETRRR